ncbi:hypothetical protein [Salimicrobium halophilum]|uniref:Uncharacterized protein n=1 Tax=Salimicrobium halophilum TaxID=86666 RepID=A0A1G8SE92_9BACI|nr:hypothetical protein [Salimicrobium halophilum]SDJ27494.1 hypothetical protein SAMN04490247_1409 [Salimicrobium halophilum]
MQLNQQKESSEFEVRYVPLMILLHISNIFSSAIRISVNSFRRKNKFLIAFILYLFLHLVYIFFISCLLGAIIYFILYVIGFQYNLDFNLGENLHFIIRILFIVFCMILIMNFKDLNFELPDLVMDFFSLLVVLMVRFQRRKLLISIVLIMMFTFLVIKLFEIIITFLNNMNPQVTNVEKVAAFVFIVLLLLIVAIISESTTKKSSSTKRKFLLWLILFIGVFFVTRENIINLLFKEETDWTELYTPVLSLFFSFALVLDKGRDAYIESLEERREDLEELKSKLLTYPELYRIVKEFSGNIYYAIYKFLNVYKLEFKNNPTGVIKATFFTLLFAIILSFLLFNFLLPFVNNNQVEIGF